MSWRCVQTLDKRLNFPSLSDCATYGARKHLRTADASPLQTTPQKGGSLETLSGSRRLECHARSVTFVGGHLRFLLVGRHICC
eukprot:6186468-Pleurochrysis_carterae.AAC.2